LENSGLAPLCDVSDSVSARRHGCALFILTNFGSKSGVTFATSGPRSVTRWKGVKVFI